MPTSPKKKKSRGKSKRPKIGLVLGGGGARGFSHIGIYKELLEHNIPIDYIAGSSIGAVIGAGIAYGRKPEFIFKIAKEFGNPKHRFLRALRQIGIMEGAFMSAHDIVSSLKKMIPKNTNFKDLKIPFRVVAVNLETGEPEIIKTGNVLKAVQASAAIPGVYPPVFHQDKVYIDGGVLNNVPVNVCQEMGADKTIAVSVKSFISEQYMSAMIYHYYWQRRRELKLGIRVKRFLFKELKMRTRFPVMVLLRSMAIAQTLSTERIIEKYKPDLVIHPDVSSFGMLQFEACEEIYKRGIEAAQHTIMDIKKLSKSPE